MKLLFQELNFLALVFAINEEEGLVLIIGFFRLLATEFFEPFFDELELSLMFFIVFVGEKVLDEGEHVGL